MTAMMWEEMADPKNAVFFVDLVSDKSIFYRHAISSELGGYVHIRDETGKMIYSYDVEDKTISLSSVPFPTCHMLLWECRLEGDHREAQCIIDSKREGEDKMLATSVMDDKVEFNSMMSESGLQNIPFHLLEMIMEFCVGVEYMHFRATCKRCHLAAPLIPWSNKETATLISPWLMVVDKNQGIITFTDPVFGDKYFMRNSLVSIHDDTICCSRFGWVLFHSSADVTFVNPFTSAIRKLPATWRFLDSVCFSAPPTSPDCMVAGFTLRGEPHVYIHLVAREQTWRRIRLYDGPSSFCFPTLYGRDLYTISKNGELYAFRNIVQQQAQEQDYVWSKVVGAQSRFGQYFLVNCDQHLLLVIVGHFGETVEVFKLNDHKREWEMIESIGRYTIYISRTTCLSMEAKTSEMENKIFFPRLHSKNGKIVFYSLKTCRFHTFDGKNIIKENSNIGIEHVNPNVWIEPSWS
uniref:F-box protein At4g00893-like n=1 Tax=Erigeron canadensis TaxID=72917 RepID=UPI001CB960F1|nr:F-box protein At4g00893-like [Erigeron canadensis]